MMKRNIWETIFGTATLLMLAACSEDELSSPTGGVEGAVYPLKIGSVSIVAQSSEEQRNSSQQTRVTEGQTNGNNSVWLGNETIGVRMSYDPIYNVPTTEGQYTISVNENKFSATAVQGKEVYWRSAYYDGTVLAWYPAENGSLSLNDQSNGLTYALKGSGSGNFAHDGTTVNLTFTHQLAKVRVVLAGERVSQVTKVEVFGYTSCTNTQGTVTTNGAQQDWITMHKATYTDGNTYWEANLVPDEIGNQETQPFVRLNGTTEVPISTLTELKAGNLHTVTVTVRAYPSDATEITSSTGNISGNGNYYVTGNLTSAINITGGSPHIYLYNANVTNSTGSAISITGNSTPTIHVVGKNNTVKCTGNTKEQEGAGIYVASGSCVTIQGNGRSDVLTTQAGQDGAGIGGYGRITKQNNTVKPCGDIIIKNVTVYAHSAYYGMYHSPGIGSAGECGTIKIEDATVYAHGSAQYESFAPAIGSCTSTAPTVTISDSDIYAYRGGFQGSCTADYIGRGSGDSYEGGKIQGTISNTTVYKYTYDVGDRQTKNDGSQVFE